MNTLKIARVAPPIRFLLVSDFDGTIAKTFEPGPNGIGVNEAYEEALKLIFGPEGKKIYQQIGGLKNRTPIELINEIILKDVNLLQQAKKFFYNKFSNLLSLIPTDKGITLVWEEKDLNWSPLPVIAEMLVQVKLSILWNEIGKRQSNGQKWPEPCQGFIEFYKKLEKINQKGEMNFEMAIISSGHDRFIQKTFKNWSLRCPEIMVTDDDLRGLAIPIQNKVKPSGLLFDLVHFRWLENQQANLSPVQLIGQTIMTRSRMVYFGDDESKDGQLAKNSQVPFGFFDTKLGSNSSFSFNNWLVIAEKLEIKREKIIKSKSLKNIFI